jgi:hypothetical protein
VVYRFWHLDVYAVVTLFDWKSIHPVIKSGCFPGDRAIVPPVPGASKKSVLDTAFTKRTALVGTSIVQGTILAVVAGQGEGVGSCNDGRYAVFRKALGIEYLVPDFLLGCRHVIGGVVLDSREFRSYRGRYA